MNDKEVVQVVEYINKCAIKVSSEAWSMFLRVRGPLSFERFSDEWETKSDVRWKETMRCYFAFYEMAQEICAFVIDGHRHKSFLYIADRILDRIKDNKYFDDPVLDDLDDRHILLDTEFMRTTATKLSDYCHLVLIPTLKYAE